MDNLSIVSLMVLDSTYNANGTKKSLNEPTENASGMIGNAQTFTGAGEYTDDFINATNQYDNMENLTCSFWLHRPSTASLEYHILGNRQHHTAGAPGFSFLKRYTQTGALYMRANDGTNTRAPGGTTAYDGNNNCWAYVTGIIDTKVPKLYVNASLKGTDSALVTDTGVSGYNFRIGINPNAENGPFVGSGVDEVRISNIPRNSSWMTACYNTAVNTTTFVTSGSEESWMLAGGTNPDTGSPWSWSFDFESHNDTGYYEFYSIGKKSGSTDETPPGTKDASCYWPGNTAPTVDDKTPVNESTGVSPCPAVTVEAYVNDTDGDTLAVTWATNESGSWINKYTNTSQEANPTASYQFSNFSNYSTTY